MEYKGNEDYTESILVKILQALACIFIFGGLIGAIIIASDVYENGFLSFLCIALMGMLIGCLLFAIAAIVQSLQSIDYAIWCIVPYLKALPAASTEQVPPSKAQPISQPQSPAIADTSASPAADTQTPPVPDTQRKSD